jgi:hypothetical protein
MTPQQAISQLDRQIQKHGQTILLRRIVPNASSIEVTIKALVRGYRSDELTGGIIQGDSQVAVSPSSLVGTRWPADGLKRGDKVVVSGRLRNVETAVPISIGDELVRTNLQVRG